LTKIPTAHFGTAAKDAVDWRKETDEDPDDTELAVTPPDVVKMLGFDPVKEGKSKATFADVNKAIARMNLTAHNDGGSAPSDAGKSATKGSK